MPSPAPHARCRRGRDYGVSVRSYTPSNPLSFSRYSATGGLSSREYHAPRSVHGDHSGHHGYGSDRARAPRRAPPGVVELHLSNRVKIRIEGNVLRSMPIHEISQLHVSIRFHREQTFIGAGRVAFDA